jgi:lytic transglycosylase catalytic
MTAKMQKKQKSLLILFFIVLSILLIIVGGYYAIKTLYPLDYVSTIQKYSEENDLDPYFTCAVIDTESGFDTSAVSRVGATGLMQLMPDTAKWIAGKLGEEYSEDSLTNPETNIKYGTWYLRYLLDKYNGDETSAIAAYNAGHSNVDEWKDKIPDGDSISTEDIPFEETKNYVKKVSFAHDVYQKLYPNL